MTFSKTQIVNLYRRRAASYDLSANLYYLVGFREQAYRKRAVAALQLQPGDTVVDLCCGTGLNFSLIQKSVGPEGRIIGVDLTDRMLDLARFRVKRNGWKNVELVRADAASYVFPEEVDGVLSTFAITLVPEYDKVIQRAAGALSPGKRCVVLDLKLPERIPRWLVRFAVFITRPFGVTLDLAARHPWESMERHLNRVSLEEKYMGFAYIACGEGKQ